MLAGLYIRLSIVTQTKIQKDRFFISYKKKTKHSHSIQLRNRQGLCDAKETKI